MSFQFHDLPTKHEEAWKYTSLRPLEGRQFQKAEESGTKSYDKNLALKEKNSEFTNIIFVNGFFCKELSDHVPRGQVLLLPLEDKPKAKAFIKAYQLADNVRTDRLDLMNIQEARQGYKLVVKGKLNKPLHLIHVVHDRGQDLVCFTRNHIVFAKGADATLVETFVSFEEKNVSHAQTDILLKEASILNYVSNQNQGPAHTHFNHTRVFLKSQARFDMLGFSVGAELARNNLDVHFLGQQAQATVNGVYAVGGKQHIDNHTLIHHRRGANASKQIYKGLLSGESRAVFTGKVVIEEGAQKASSEQLVKNLLLSPKAEADSEPQLQIYADDVKASHGSTVGPLNPEEIFYLQSRAVKKEEAIQMLSLGFVQDLVFGIREKSVRLWMLENLKRSYERVCAL